MAVMQEWQKAGRLGGGHFPGWAGWITLLLGVLALLPIVPLLWVLPQPSPEVWQLIRPQLPGLFADSLGLAAGVVLVSGLLGTGLAGLTTLCDFPGRRFFSWALLLPLAMPAYVLGFVAVGLFDVGGPVQQIWLAWQGDAASFPPIRSVAGLTLSLSLSFYPYVYLAARHGFLTQSGPAMEAARNLGAGANGAFFRAGLPAAKPWIAASLAVVAMETLADLGTVSVFRQETFTTAIYRSWNGTASLPLAACLAAGLLLLAGAALAFEQHQRNWQRHHQRFAIDSIAKSHRLPDPFGALASLAATLVFGLGFVLPVGQLLAWSIANLAQALDRHVVDALWHSLLMASVGAALTVMAALAVSLAKRRHDGTAFGFLRCLACAGHAVPGAVLAVGIAIPAAVVGKRLADLAKAQLDIDTAPFIGGSLAVLLLAYLIRFLALAVDSTDKAFSRVTPNMGLTAHSLGVHGYALWRQVHYPLLRKGLLAAFLLTFAAILQELPMTLLLRPAGWDTLAVNLFATANADAWQTAALPALLLVLAGLLPLILLIRDINRHG